MTAYRLTAEADEDMVAVFIQGCDLFGLRQASRYLDDLEALFPRIAANPEMTRLRLEFDPPLRAFGYKAHVVIYDVDDEGVRILRIRHSHEDWHSDPAGHDTP